MNKKSFVLYADYKQHIDMLDRDGKADLLEYIFDYVNGEEVVPEGNASFVFSFIKAQIDRDDEKYNKFKEKQRVNGAKGGRPKKPKPKPNNPSLNSETQKSLTDTVTVTVNDTVNDIKKETCPTKKEKLEAFDVFYSQYPLKKGKKQAIKAWDKLTPQEMQEAIDRVSTEDFQIHMRKQVRGKKDYRKHPATWLNSGCWSDEITTTTYNTGEPF